MEEKLLSVIIPVYNTEKYLKRCLDSVIKAVEFMKNNVQIIVINDGSKDNSELIINEYLNKFNNIFTYIKQKNKGLGETKNIGIKNAKGKYLSFIDSDDYIDKNFYKEAFDVINKSDVDIVICDWETIDKNSKYIVNAKDQKYDNDRLGCIDVQIMPSSCNKIVKKELFKNLKFPKNLRYEDLATTLIVILKSKSIYYLNKPFYKYYLSENSIMRSDFDEKIFQMIDIFEILFNRLDEIDNKYITKNEKEIYEYMVYTRRFYEEIIEKIVINCFDRNKKLSMCKILCNKICRINKLMYSNKYFYDNVIVSQKVIKKIGNRILHFLINNNHYKLLSFILKKSIYYKFISVRYIGKDIIDKVNKKGNI